MHSTSAPVVSESFEVVRCGGAGAFEVIDFAIDLVKLDFPLLGLLAVFVLPIVDCFSPAACLSEVGVRKRPIPELIRLLVVLLALLIFDFVSNFDSTFPLFPSPFGGFIDDGGCNLEADFEGIVSSTAVLEVVEGRICSRTSFVERSEAREPRDDAESDLPGRSPFLFGITPL